MKSLMYSLIIAIFLVSLSAFDRLEAASASRVWFEFMKNGQYKVHFNYTLPEQREVRESYVIFKKKKKAERFYWSLIRGADFFNPDPESTKFIPPKMKAKPW